MFDLVVILLTLCYVAFGASAAAYAVSEGGLQRMIPPLTLAEICVVITFGWLPILVYAITFGRNNTK